MNSEIIGIGCCEALRAKSMLHVGTNVLKYEDCRVVFILLTYHCILDRRIDKIASFPG